MKMRLILAGATVVVGVLAVSHGAFADGRMWGGGGGGWGGGGNPAPAPLLAAGIPAFVALGGGVAARRLVQKFRRHS